MTLLKEETKQQIIDEEPGGIWLVLEEENPIDGPTPGDLVGPELEDCG